MTYEVIKMARAFGAPGLREKVRLTIDEENISFYHRVTPIGGEAYWERIVQEGAVEALMVDFAAEIALPRAAGEYSKPFMYSLPGTGVHYRDKVGEAFLAGARWQHDRSRAPHSSD